MDLKGTFEHIFDPVLGIDETQVRILRDRNEQKLYDREDKVVGVDSAIAMMAQAAVHEPNKGVRIEDGQGCETNMLVDAQQSHRSL